MARKTKGKSIRDVAREIGLEPMVCHCGNKIQMIDSIYELFEYIIREVKQGNTVRVKNFGVFFPKKYKGRVLNTPILKDPGMFVEDSVTIGFRASGRGKELLKKRQGKD